MKFYYNCSKGRGINGISKRGMLTLPSSLTTIGNGAFRGFGNSNERIDIYISSGVTSIGEEAFFRSTAHSLCETYYHIGNATPPTCAESSFGGSNSYGNAVPFTIYVPSELMDTYKAAAGWSAFAYKIEAEPVE